MAETGEEGGCLPGVYSSKTWLQWPTSSNRPYLTKFFHLSNDHYELGDQAFYVWKYGKYFTFILLCLFFIIKGSWSSHNTFVHSSKVSTISTILILLKFKLLFETPLKLVNGSPRYTLMRYNDTELTFPFRNKKKKETTQVNLKFNPVHLCLAFEAHSMCSQYSKYLNYQNI